MIEQTDSELTSNYLEALELLVRVRDQARKKNDSIRALMLLIEEKAVFKQEANLTLKQLNKDYVQCKTMEKSAEMAVDSCIEELKRRNLPLPQPMPEADAGE